MPAFFVNTQIIASLKFLDICLA